MPLEVSSLLFRIKQLLGVSLAIYQQLSAYLFFGLVSLVLFTGYLA
jgi:hypothetical protein